MEQVVSLMLPDDWRGVRGSRTSRTFILFGYVAKEVKAVGSKFICGPMSIGGSNPLISAPSIYRHI